LFTGNCCFYLDPVLYYFYKSLFIAFGINECGIRPAISNSLR
jgi:hypothetical protein